MMNKAVIAVAAALFFSGSAAFASDDADDAAESVYKQADETAEDGSDLGVVGKVREKIIKTFTNDARQETRSSGGNDGVKPGVSQ